jgi:hypothetical protein
MARPPYVPTEQDRLTVRAMVAGGIDQTSIARVIGVTKERPFGGVDQKTLRKHFRRELDAGALELNAAVVASLHVMATKGKNVAAAIWWTKTRMGWREAPQELQHSGVDGAPIAVVYSWAEAEQPKLAVSKPRLVE